MSAIALLRAQTHHAHEAVDAAFARFALDDRADYRAFLLAHARAVPVAERWAGAVYPLRPRTPLLVDDLATLGKAMPGPIEAAAIDEAGAWGALYTLEGSRLGGRLLAARVPDGLPSAYLGAIHLPGEWRATRAAIDTAGAGQDDAWRARMVAGALATFDLYRRAASGVAGGRIE